VPAVALDFNGGSRSFAIGTAILTVIACFTVARWMGAFLFLGHKSFCRLDRGQPKKATLRIQFAQMLVQGPARLLTHFWTHPGLVAVPV
jgi:hypothetical protein